MSSDGNDEGEDVSGLGSRGPVFSSSATLLDGDFLEFTNGRPLPLTDRAKAVFHMSVLNVSEVWLGNYNFIPCACPNNTFSIFAGHIIPIDHQRLGLLDIGRH
jgi:hypothetical protein